MSLQGKWTHTGAAWLAVLALIVGVMTITLNSAPVPTVARPAAVAIDAPACPDQGPDAVGPVAPGGTCQMPASYGDRGQYTVILFTAPCPAPGDAMWARSGLLCVDSVTGIEYGPAGAFWTQPLANGHTHGKLMAE
jgi:hypothetical protein